MPEPSTVNGRSKWRAPTAFFIVLLVSAGYVIHYINPRFDPPAELIPALLLAGGYLFGLDYDQLIRRKK